ncbi:hypothetical protein Syun_018935 [Stephania yunnanensis]|uniref:Uncharacterized protein n=1 Tax=Stephania yunnanensis TaxID=152371 RepID=A0AAP0IT62_9MAGN
MTDGMTTRVKAIDEAISKLQEQVRLQASTHEQNQATFHQQYEVFARMTSFCDSIQTTVTEMLQRMNVLEKQPTSPTASTTTLITHTTIALPTPSTTHTPSLLLHQPLCHS